MMNGSRTSGTKAAGRDCARGKNILPVALLQAILQVIGYTVSVPELLDRTTRSFAVASRRLIDTRVRAPSSLKIRERLESCTLQTGPDFPRRLSVATEW
jgi:hypothetical protein